MTNSFKIFSVSPLKKTTSKILFWIIPLFSSESFARFVLMIDPCKYDAPWQSDDVTFCIKTTSGIGARRLHNKNEGSIEGMLDLYAGLHYNDLISLHISKLTVFPTKPEKITHYNQSGLIQISNASSKFWQIQIGKKARAPIGIDNNILSFVHRKHYDPKSLWEWTNQSISATIDNHRKRRMQISVGRPGNSKSLHTAARISFDSSALNGSRYLISFANNIKTQRLGLAIIARSTAKDQVSLEWIRKAYRISESNFDQLLRFTYSSPISATEIGALQIEELRFNRIMTTFKFSTTLPNFVPINFFYSYIKNLKNGSKKTLIASDIRFKL